MDNDTDRQPVAETADADNSEPPTLLSLTTELLLLIVERLPAVSICRFGLVSRAAQDVAHADEVWSVLLDQVWPDAAAATSMMQRREEPALKGRMQQLAAAALGLVQRRSVEGPAPKGCMQQFAALSYSPYPEVRAVGPELTWKDSAQNEIRFGQTSRVAASATSCAWGLCHGSLLLDSTPPRRCICVPTRSKLPLRIASLSRERAGSSSFDQGGFSHMLRTLRACYDVEGTREHGTEHADLSITSLRAELLAPLDVLVLCTTEGPALSEPELAALRSWVEAGGALIVSAFSNWSAHNHFAAQTVGWLGLQTMPLASFGGITVMSSVI